MGYWSNLWDALLGRQPSVVIPMYTRTVPATESEKLPPELIEATAPITEKEHKTIYGSCLSVEHSFGGFTPLPLIQRQTIAQTIETLSNDPKDIETVCGLQPNQAKYVAKAYSIDKKWAQTVELSTLVEKKDVQMLYFILKQCNNYSVTARLFGINYNTMMGFLDIMDPLEKREAEQFTVFPDNSPSVRLGSFVKGLSDDQLANLLRIFRKIQRVNSLRFVIPMYSNIKSTNASKKLFALWEYAAKEEIRRENDKS